MSVERENEKKKRERREGDLGVLVAAVEDLPLRHLLSVLGVHLVDGGERRRPHQLPPRHLTVWTHVCAEGVSKGGRRRGRP